MLRENVGQQLGCTRVSTIPLDVREAVSVTLLELVVPSVEVDVEDYDRPVRQTGQQKPEIAAFVLMDEETDRSY